MDTTKVPNSSQFLFLSFYSGGKADLAVRRNELSKTGAILVTYTLTYNTYTTVRF